MAHIFKRLSNALSSNFSFVKNLAVDSKLLEYDANTVMGKGFLFCQLRENASDGQYVVLKSKGGEATVWVGLSLAEFDKIHKLIHDFSDRPHKDTLGPEEGSPSPIV